LRGIRVLSLSAIAIEEGGSVTRAVWLRGAAGSLHVEKAIRITEGDRSPRAAVEKLKLDKVPVKGISLGVNGQSATLRYNLVPPVPDWRLELIMKYETEEMVEKSGEPLSCDWRQLDVPESAADDQILLVGLGKDNLVQPRIDQIEQGGGRVSSVTPSAIGLFHAYRQGIKGIPRETVVLADLGGMESHIVIAADGRLLFARSVNFGGNHVDSTIATALDLPDEKARQLKEKLGKGELPDHVEQSVQPALRSVFGQLNSMIGSSITFCKAQTKIPELQIDRVLLCGGTSALGGLAEYLEGGLSIPVEVFVPPVDAPPAEGMAQEWNVVIGLAASHLDPKSSLDLLSAPAKAKREFRERTVFLYASAAVLVLALIVKLAAGFVASSATSALADDVSNHETEVRSWEQEHKSAQEKNGRINAQIDRTVREVFNTSFQARVHEALRQSTPRAIALTGIDTVREEVDGSVYLAMEIRGNSDNSDRRGIEYVSALEVALRKVPGVAIVKPDVEDPEDGVRPFRLLVSPDLQRPEKKSGPRRRRRGG